MKLWKLIEKHKLFSIFIITVIGDFWSNWYGYAVMHDWIVLQAFLGMAMPLIYFPQGYLFIEAKGLKERFKITIVCALAMSLGSTLMLLMVNN
jgi:hypothetical protein